MTLDSRAGTTEPATLIELVESSAATIFNVLEEASLGLVGALQSLPGSRRADALRLLEIACRDGLTSNGDLVGMGFVGAPEREFSAELQIAWWRKQGTEIRTKKHVLNPASDSYYDYNTSEWFATVRTTGKPYISAPYVDSWGTDELTITAAIPLSVHGVFVGVMATDLDQGRYLKPIERLLLKDHNLALVDSEDRIILSSIPVLTAGMSLHRYLKQTDGEPGTRVQSELTHWQVVELL